MRKNKFRKILIFILVFAWLFIGFPPIWQNPRIPNLNSIRSNLLLSGNSNFRVDEEPEFRIRVPAEMVIKTAVKKSVANLFGLFGVQTVSAEELNAPPIKGKLFNFATEKSIDVTLITETIGGETKITIPKLENQFRPGKYTLTVEMADGEKVLTGAQDFTWGVLAINVNKSIYQPGETAYLQMASLNEYGHTICDAKLRLQILNPKSEILNLSTEGGTIKYGGECGPNNVTDKPDYFAYYRTDGPGTYQMKLTNLDNGYEITDYFETRENVPFEVERVGATRINPFLSNYKMTLHIKAGQDFDGEIIEKLPSDFEVIDAGGGKVKNSTLKKEIIWKVHLKNGEQTTLRYEYKAPEISPELFLLGPAEFKQGGSLVFEEARQWQIVADAGYVATKSANWNDETAWTTAGYPGKAAGDTASIGNFTMTVTANPANTVTSVTFTSTTGGAITVNTGIALTVSGAVTANNTANASGTVTISGSGTLNAGSLAVGGTATPTTDNTLTLNSTVTIFSITNGITLTGTDAGSKENLVVVNLNGGSMSAASIALTTVSQAYTTFTMAAAADGTILTLSGATPFSGTGTFTAASTANTSIVDYSGSSQTVKAVIYDSLTLSGSGTKTMTSVTTVNNNFTMSGSAATSGMVVATIGGNVDLSGTAQATTGAALTITGTLTVGSGTIFATGATNTWTLSAGTTSVTGTLTLANTGTKTFTGNVTVNSGGVWNETAAAAINYAGNLQNDGTTFTANTGVHSFTVTGKTISGASTIAIPNLTISAGISTTNNGTLTVSTALAGATGTLVNGTTGILNLGGTSAINTLTATAVGNTVNYTGTDQTLKVTAYHHLTLSGGAETFGAITTIGGNLTLSGAATAQTAASITLGGDIIVGTGTTLTIGADIGVNGGDITVTSTGALASSGTPMVTMGAAGAISGTGNVTIYDLTISASGTTVLSATGTNTITGSVAVSAGSTIDIQQSVAITGSITTTTTGIINSTAGTPTVTVSGTSIGGGTGNITFFNLTKSGAGTTTWTNATTNTVDNNLNISAGTFVAPAGILFVGGNYSNSSIFTHSSGTIILNGSGQQTLSGTMTGADGQFYNLTIANSSGSITSTCPTTSVFTPGIIFGAAADVNVSNNYSIATDGLGAGVYVRYNSGSTYTFANISWVGTLAKKIYFRNSNLTTGTWALNVTGTQSISYVDVASSNATSYPVIKAYVTATSTDCGSGDNANTNWSFTTIISVTITTADKTVSYGNLAFEEVKSTIDLSKTKTVQNDGNVAEDFTIKTSAATAGTGTNWALGSSAGENVFVHEFSSNGSDGPWTKFITADEESVTPLASDVAPDDTRSLDLRITAPTSSDNIQKTITVTVRAAQHF